MTADEQAMEPPEGGTLTREGWLHFRAQESASVHVVQPEPRQPGVRE